MNSKTVRCLTWLCFKRFKEEVFNAFVKVIPNFYNCKANFEFTIVCQFDGVNIIGWIRSKPGFVWVYGCYCLKKIFKGRRKTVITIVIHEECIVKGNKINYFRDITYSDIMSILVNYFWHWLYFNHHSSGSMAIVLATFTYSSREV